MNTMTPASVFVALIPTLFVLLWSTGWISARFASDYADPLTFLTVRNFCAFVLMGAFALAVGASWPKRAADWAHGLLTGVLLHGIYLGGVWWAVKHGLPTAISGLIAALQPLMTTALAGPLGGETIRGKQITGIAIGLGGVFLVLSPKLFTLQGSGQWFWPIVINVIAMAGVTLGTFYQKFALKDADLRSVSAVQSFGAFVFTGLGALAFESLNFSLTAPVFGALAWSVLVLSIFAWTLMALMIRRGAVSKVASLVYLVPPTVAVQAFLMFGETLDTVQIAGMIVTAIGVFLATRPG